MRQRRLHHLLTGGLASMAGCAALVLAAPGVEAARADDAQVTVVGPGGRQQTLSLEALAGQEDLRERPYALRSSTGEATRTVTGFSLASIVEAAGADPFGFSYLEVQRPAGGAVVLSRHQALDPGAFEDGPPVLYSTTGGTGFLRPATGPGDLNAADSFEAPQGITVALHSGSPLRVRAKASRLRVRPGQQIAFEAIVDRSGSGEELLYSWYFDDGASADGPTARHSFARRGSYDVVVGVTTPGDRAGASAVVSIQVGAPLSGPDRKGGGRDRNLDAPDHGAASGARGVPPPGPGSPEGAPSSTPPVAAQDPARPSGSRRTPAADRQPAGVPVGGRLIDAERTAPFRPARSTAPAPAARTGSPDGGGGGPGLRGAAIGVSLTLALLGAGALTELRGVWP